LKVFQEGSRQLSGQREIIQSISYRDNRGSQNCPNELIFYLIHKIITAIHNYII
jgi:hypothetical protein